MPKAQKRWTRGKKLSPSRVVALASAKDTLRLARHYLNEVATLEGVPELAGADVNQAIKKVNTAERKILSGLGERAKPTKIYSLRTHHGRDIDREVAEIEAIEKELGYPHGEPEED